MSRLDSFIRRLEAQRACIDHACRLIVDLPGPVLELGLGNGRTFDHLRSRLPEREIFVFDRQVNAHPDCIPDPEQLFVGDIHDTLEETKTRLPGPAALVHTDLGTGDAASNAVLARWLAGKLPELTAPRAIVIADQPLDHPLLEPIPLPPGVAAQRYFLYRRASKSGYVMNEE